MWGSVLDLVPGGGVAFVVFSRLEERGALSLAG